ncbi:sporulation protein [Aneurinibacillus sp. Ricciae_BoGa-3]|uniref:sporulation protein n=1 Tax=Aneurinibacillus sp. Ricciae_BoGa-3 TaxID=3022697 RepID=UPI00234090BA|nr:sporulation protein [Aneurinibacillus sp. Ricciae_BoGa-3]WCK54392.1 sporulation protein [Aneurinibacillus sp. Ricciae_BoGa-3]
MLEKILASFGIGSAKVDTRIAEARVRIGQELTGEIHITGGVADQSISQIYMSLYTNYYRETAGTNELKREVLVSIRVSDSLTIQAGGKKVIPFKLQIPYHTPASFGRQHVYIKTGLDIDLAVDATDRDTVVVLPDLLMDQVLAELESMGFRHTNESGICTYRKHIHRMVPFVQEFELEPTALFRSELDDIQLIFDVHPSGVDILMEINRNERGLKNLVEEMLNLDEEYTRFSLDRKTGLIPGVLETRIREAINRGREARKNKL